MAQNFGRELADLHQMSGTELRQRYEEVFGEVCRSNHKAWLIKRIAWRLQANAEGDLSERARRRAEELADDADLRLKAPAPRSSKRRSKTPQPNAQKRDTRLPPPGTTLTRRYKGKRLEVAVLEVGFEYEGISYQSLSAVAKAITGSHTSGFLFFRLNRQGGRA